MAGDGGGFRLAQPGRRLHSVFEHGLQVEGRAADDLEHVGGGGLLLQGFGQIVSACCTSSNSRIFSIAITAWSAKVGSEFNLFLSEWFNLLVRVHEK